MSLRLLSGLILLLALACQPSPAPASTVAPVGSARVVAPDRIYFKNVRASRYGTVDDHENYLTIYTHDKLKAAPAAWQLKITDDWINDQAWLSFGAGEPGLFYRTGAEGEEMSILDYRQYPDIEAVKTFSQRLAAPYEICFRELTASTADCLPSASPIRLAIRETISDYLRLTDQDR